MSRAAARMLPDGKRLHFHHGPIDLIILAEGRDSQSAFNSAWSRFQVVLTELMQELSLLYTNWADISTRPKGSIAQRMYDSVAPHGGDAFITPMAAVAGSVAEEILDCMIQKRALDRAIVNNGGDIAFHLKNGESCSATLADLEGHRRGDLEVTSEMPIRGIATSGRGGRSHSFGIADSVTVLAKTAAAADAAATLIANAVDLPEHPAISRCPARQLQDDSDLGHRPVVTDCGNLLKEETEKALEAGIEVATGMRERGLIEAAILFLNGITKIVGERNISPISLKRRLLHA